MTPSDRLKEAALAAEQGRWADAGFGWVSIASALQDAGSHPQAASLYGSAGEAFRRADMLVNARNALGLAFTLSDPTDSGRVSLASILTEQGEIDAARDQLERASGPVAEDSRAGWELSYGTLEGFEQAANAIQHSTARLFRQAQLARMRGDLKRADERLLELWELVREQPAAAAGVQLEQAEIAALRDETDDAIRLYERLAKEHHAAGRVGLSWKARVARLRVCLDAGLVPMHQAVDDGIKWAADHGFVVLHLDGRLQRARLIKDGAELSAVRDQSLEMGAWRRAGRASFALGEQSNGAVALGHYQDAVRSLASDRPLAWRAEVCLVEAWSLVAPNVARQRAEQLVTKVRESGMRSWNDRLEEVHARCSNP